MVGGGETFSLCGHVWCSCGRVEKSVINKINSKPRANADKEIEE